MVVGVAGLVSLWLFRVSPGAPAVQRLPARRLSWFDDRRRVWPEMRSGTGGADRSSGATQGRCRGRRRRRGRIGRRGRRRFDARDRQVVVAGLEVDRLVAVGAVVGQLGVDAQPRRGSARAGRRLRLGSTGTGSVRRRPIPRPATSGSDRQGIDVACPRSSAGKNPNPPSELEPPRRAATQRPGGSLLPQMAGMAGTRQVAAVSGSLLASAR